MGLTTQGAATASAAHTRTALKHGRVVTALGVGDGLPNGGLSSTLRTDEKLLKK